MDINAAFPSDYLKAADLQNRQVEVVMERVEMVELGGDHKPCLYFEGKDRGLILNKTNANTIADIYGADTDRWKGNKVILFPTQTDFQGRQVACIRVRIHVPDPATANPNDEVPF